MAAEAVADGAGPRWACWYAPDDLTVRCLLARAPNDGHAERAEAADRIYDQRLPELVRTIWGAPERLANARIDIPLWSPPDDMPFTRELAESVMCAVRTACSVSFDANDDGQAAVRATALAAGVPEQDVMAELVAQGLVAAAVLARPAAEAPAPTQARRRRSRQAMAS